MLTRKQETAEYARKQADYREAKLSEARRDDKEHRLSINQVAQLAAGQVRAIYTKERGKIKRKLGDKLQALIDDRNDIADTERQLLLDALRRHAKETLAYVLELQAKPLEETPAFKAEFAAAEAGARKNVPLVELTANDE